MAKINLDKGLFDWAETEVDKAAELGGNAHKVETLRCEILVSKGQFDEATERIKKQLQRDPNNDNLRKLLQVAEGAVQSGARKPAAASPVIMPMADSAPQSFQAPSPERERPSLSAEEFMNECVAQSGAFGGVQLDFDGNTLCSAWNNVGSEKEYAALAGEMVRLTTEALERVELGAPRAALIETDSIAVYALIGDGEIFAFAAGEGVKASRMRAAVNHLYRDYEHAVRERGE